MNPIKSRRVISEPGAAIKCVEIELTDEGRKALTIPCEGAEAFRKMPITPSERRDWRRRIEREANALVVFVFTIGTVFGAMLVGLCWWCA